MAALALSCIAKLRAASDDGVECVAATVYRTGAGSQAAVASRSRDFLEPLFRATDVLAARDGVNHHVHLDRSQQQGERAEGVRQFQWNRVRFGEKMRPVSATLGSKKRVLDT
jgi:hypothetical protein